MTVRFWEDHINDKKILQANTSFARIRTKYSLLLWNITERRENLYREAEKNCFDMCNLVWL